MQSFYELPRGPGDTSPFAHWLTAGRLFVTPNAGWPTKYNNSLVKMMPGDPIFAYEAGVGLVALGHVTSPKNLQDSSGGTKLYPKLTEKVRSVAVDWDPSVRRSMQVVASRARVPSWGLQQCHPGSAVHAYLLEILQDVDDKYRANPDAAEIKKLTRVTSSPGYDAKMRAQLIQARVGQGRFRQAVLAREPSCRLTGIKQPACLVASHIKPWAACVGGEHLDDANGLMLAPHVDHLFDAGLISFEDNGQLLVAPALDLQVLHAWHIKVEQNAGAFAPDQTQYLKYHRNHVFGRSHPRGQRNLVGDLPEDVLAFPW